MKPSKSVETAVDAMKIAKKAVLEAGYLFHRVREARREGDIWIVEVSTIGREYIVKIDASDGRVIEFVEWRGEEAS